MNGVFIILLALQMVGGEFTYTVVSGDSLTSVGARYGVEVRALAEMNGLGPSAKLKPGQTLQVDNRHIAPAARGTDILINIPQRMLFLYEENSVRGYPIAAGKRTWKTPLGKFTIMTLEEDPVWDVPPSIQAEMRAQGKPVLTKVPPSPANPLGRYWIGTSLPGIGIHGTNAPSSIFSLQTHGCIRLHPDNIEELFGRVQVGATGQTIYEPVLLTGTADGVFLEVHPDTYKTGSDPLVAVRELARLTGLEDVLNWSAVNETIKKRDGMARRVSLR